MMSDGAALPRLAHGRAFWVVAFAFMAAMAAAAAPTPLYALYARRDDFGSLTTTVVFAAYAVGVALALWAVGHLSDVYGRRRLLVPALTVSLATTVSFLVWRDLTGLLVARFVSGLSIGATTATATAWLGELHTQARPKASPRRGELVAVAANLGGIALGPLVAGGLATWVARPLSVPWYVFGAAQLVGLILVAVSPETRRMPESEKPPYRPQRLSAPPGSHAPFFAALASTVLAFAGFAFFSSLAPAFLAGPFGHSAPSLAGLATFIVFAGAVTAQVALHGRRNVQLIGAGATGIVLGAVAVVVAVWLASPSLGLFLGGGLLLGLGAGALFKGALSTVVRLSGEDQRAEALASLFLAAYTGLVVPSVGLGVLIQVLSLQTALSIFGGLLITGIVASAAPLHRAAGRSESEDEPASAAPARRATATS